MATVNSVIDSLCIASVQRCIAVREIDRETSIYVKDHVASVSGQICPFLRCITEWCTIDTSFVCVAQIQEQWWQPEEDQGEAGEVSAPLLRYQYYGEPRARRWVLPLKPSLHKGQSRWNTKPLSNLNTCLLSGFTVWSHYPHQYCHLWAPPPGQLWPLTSRQVNRSGSSSCKGTNTEFKLNIDYDMTMVMSEKLICSWNINYKPNIQQFVSTWMNVVLFVIL